MNTAPNGNGRVNTATGRDSNKMRFGSGEVEGKGSTQLILDLCACGLQKVNVK